MASHFAQGAKSNWDINATSPLSLSFAFNHSTHSIEAPELGVKPKAISIWRLFAAAVRDLTMKAVSLVSVVEQSDRRLDIHLEAKEIGKSHANSNTIQCRNVAKAESASAVSQSGLTFGRLRTCHSSPQNVMPSIGGNNYLVISRPSKLVFDTSSTELD